MAKASTAAPLKLKLDGKDSETRKEIDRQHTLLNADLDKKSLRGNVTVEDWRYIRHAHDLSKKERRQKFEITNQRMELLNDLKKVRSSYTGHYDDSKSPIENIQKAMRAKCMTPARSSRLDLPVHPVRRCKSQETISISIRGRSALSSSLAPSARGLPAGRLTKRPDTVHSMRPVRLQSQEPVRKQEPTRKDSEVRKAKKSGVKPAGAGNTPGTYKVNGNT